MIHAIPYSEAFHYDLLVEWWKGHGWNGIPAKLLPKKGFVVIEDMTGRPICAAFIYCDTTTPMSYMEWLVADPSMSGKNVLRAINLLIETIVQYADFNSRVLSTSVKQSGLVRVYEKHGYAKTDEGMTNLVRFGKWA